MNFEKVDIVTQIIEERKGWENAFQQMHENGDDSLLIDDVFDDENFAEES
jgi:antitoxin MazE